MNESRINHVRIQPRSSTFQLPIVSGELQGLALKQKWEQKRGQVLKQVPPWASAGQLDYPTKPFVGYFLLPMLA